MNTRWTYGLAGLACGAALLAGVCGSAVAFDRRFDLDLRTLDQKMAPAVKEKTAQPPGKSIRKAARPVPVTSPLVPAEQPVSARPEKSGEGSLSLLKMTPAVGDERMAALRPLWERLVPALQSNDPLELRADNFTLTLDPERYRVIPAADGGKIIIDASRSLPPLVRNLIQEKDPGIRVVSEHPSSGTRFFASLLQAAGFYSVEPDFSMEFGDDPRLTVRADFRIERTPDSLLHNEVVLFYTGGARYALPETLQGFLGRQGFQVIEPDLPHHDPPQRQHRFIQVSPGNQFQMADKVLSALNLDTDTGKTLELTGWANQGISLSVRVDRAFDCRGKHYALAVFDGNPVTYTLTRLLEIQGISVVVLGQQDDFRTVTTKLLTALMMPARFDSHRLWPLSETPYSVQVSGFLLRDHGTGRNIVLSDRELDPLLSDLLERNGYAVSGGQ